MTTNGADSTNNVKDVEKEVGGGKTDQAVVQVIEPKDQQQYLDHQNKNKAGDFIPVDKLTPEQQEKYKFIPEDTRPGKGRGGKKGEPSSEGAGYRRIGAPGPDAPRIRDENTLTGELTHGQLKEEAKSYWDSIKKRPHLSDASKSDTVDRAEKFQQSIERLTPEDMKTINGYLNRMNSQQDKYKSDRYDPKARDEASKLAESIGKELQEKYGSDPAKQESIVNGMMMALKKQGLATDWSVNSPYEYGNGKDLPKFFNMSFRGEGFINKLTPENNVSIDSTYNAHKDQTEPAIKQLTSMYDKAIFFGPNRNFDQVREGMEETLKKLLPTMEAAYQDMLKKDGNDSGFQSLMDKINAPLRDFAMRNGRSAEIPRVAYHPGRAPADGDKGNGSTLALDVGPARTIVIKGEIPKK